MAFKTLFLAYAPDADKEKHRSIIKTGKFELFAVVIKDFKEAIEVCEELIEKENINAVLLCPGFSHNDIAEIVKATGRKVAVAVARGDGPSSRLSFEAMKRAGIIP